MPKVSPIQTDFSGGEFSPTLFGRVDSDLYKRGLATCENYIPTVQGGLVRRSGSRYIAQVKDSSDETRLLPFEFSVTQAYVLEFGDQAIRFYKDQSQITEADQTITGVTQANPAVVTITGHPFSNGDEIIISGVVGMTELNGKHFLVANATANTFEITDVDGTNINSSAYTAYSSGGVANRVYTISSPYVKADLFELKFTQSADVLYIAHPDYAPRTLSRASDTSWTLAEIDFVDGPYLPINLTSTTITPSATTGSVTLTATASIFVSTDVGRHVRILQGSTWGYAEITGYSSGTSVTATVVKAFGATTASQIWRLGLYSETTGYPAAVTFHEDRLTFAGPTESPQRVDLSESSNYPSFAPTETDNTIENSNAISFELNSNDVNVIRWIVSEEKGLIAGTAAGEWLITPSTNGEALVPGNANTKRATNIGSADIQAIKTGRNTLFVQRAKREIRELNYYFGNEGFNALDVTEVCEQLTKSGVVEMAFQKTPQPIAWLVRADGTLAGLTYQRVGDNLQIAGHRHILGGQSDSAATQAKVESVCVIPSSDTTTYEVWLIVNREVNGVTRRYVEVLEQMFDDDIEQKDAFFVDSGLSYDAPFTITGATAADPVVVTTSSAHGFSNGDKVLISGVKGMTELNSESFLVANVTATTFELQDLSSTDIDGSAYTAYVSGGEVRKYVTTVSGLDHLEGETVSVLGDGAVQPDKTVSSGSITLATNATTVQVGLSYNSRAKTLRFEAGAADGTSIGKTRRIHRIGFLFHRSLGLKIGRSFDELTELTFRTGSDELSRAPELFTGIRSEIIDMGYDFENQVCWEQSQPLPSMVLSIMPQMVTQDRG